jgi:hypothetical protein
MSYIFLDESGDLGFKLQNNSAHALNDKGFSSNYFLITLVFTSNVRKIEKVVGRVHAGLKKSHKAKRPALHAYQESPTTVVRMLTLLAKTDIKVMTIYLNKHKVYTKLKEEKNVLYNYVTNILLDRIYSKGILPRTDGIALIASQKDTSKFLINNFKQYLADSVERNHKLKINVEVRSPYREKSLQAVDFVSWAIFRKYEFGDEYFYDMIKGNIFEENGLFK